MSVPRHSLDDALPHPLWWEGLPAAATRPRLSGDLDADVAIVGAGYTGLWTAYALAERDPSLRIVIVERRHVGFGASGRNGGWCYNGFAAGLDRIERRSDRATAIRFAAALRDTVDEIAATIAREEIAADAQRGGSIEFLRNGGQLARAEEDVALALRYGETARDIRLLSAQEATSIGRASGVMGGLWLAHTIALHPARLVHGLAAAVERRGATIAEDTTVVEILPGRVITSGGTVRARVVIRATEGYTAELAGHHRRLAPIYSLMIATEPLPDHAWAEIGLADRTTFGDLRHLVIYGQRTSDGRIAFGGRGAPYDYASRVRPNADFPPETFQPVVDALVDLFPQLAGVRISHRWGGVLGVGRTWFPSVEFDRVSGLGWAGGYVGSGVAATNLAGRTLADLIIGASTDLTAFPWVNHPPRRWEPEPLRWLGINGALRIMRSADAAEARTGRPARRAAVLWKAIEY